MTQGSTPATRPGTAPLGRTIEAEAPSVTVSIGRHLRRYGLARIHGRELLAMRVTLIAEIETGERDTRLGTHLVRQITDELNRRVQATPTTRLT